MEPVEKVINEQVQKDIALEKLIKKEEKNKFDTFNFYQEKSEFIPKFVSSLLVGSIAEASYIVTAMRLNGTNYIDPNKDTLPFFLGSLAIIGQSFLESKFFNIADKNDNKLNKNPFGFRFSKNIASVDNKELGIKKGDEFCILNAPEFLDKEGKPLKLNEKQARAYSTIISYSLNKFVKGKDGYDIKGVYINAPHLELEKAEKLTKSNKRIKREELFKGKKTEVLNEPQKEGIFIPMEELKSMFWSVKSDTNEAIALSNSPIVQEAYRLFQESSKDEKTRYLENFKKVIEGELDKYLRYTSGTDRPILTTNREKKKVSPSVSFYYKEGQKMISTFTKENGELTPEKVLQVLKLSENPTIDSIKRYNVNSDLTRTRALYILSIMCRDQNYLDHMLEDEFTETGLKKYLANSGIVIENRNNGNFLNLINQKKLKEKSYNHNIKNNLWFASALIMGSLFLRSTDINFNFGNEKYTHKLDNSAESVKPIDHVEFEIKAVGGMDMPAFIRESYVDRIIPSEDNGVYDFKVQSNFELSGLKDLTSPENIIEVIKDNSQKRIFKVLKDSNNLLGQERNNFNDLPPYLNSGIQKYIRLTQYSESNDTGLFRQLYIPENTEISAINIKDSKGSGEDFILIECEGSYAVFLPSNDDVTIDYYATPIDIGEESAIPYTAIYDPNFKKGNISELNTQADQIIRNALIKNPNISIAERISTVIREGYKYSLNPDNKDILKNNKNIYDLINNLAQLSGLYCYPSNALADVLSTLEGEYVTLETGYNMGGYNLIPTTDDGKEALFTQVNGLTYHIRLLDSNGKNIDATPTRLADDPETQTYSKQLQDLKNKKPEAVNQKSIKDSLKDLNMDLIKLLAVLAIIESNTEGGYIAYKQLKNLKSFIDKYGKESKERKKYFDSKMAKHFTRKDLEIANNILSWIAYSDQSNPDSIPTNNLFDDKKIDSKVAAIRYIGNSFGGGHERIKEFLENSKKFENILGGLSPQTISRIRILAFYTNQRGRL